MQQGTLYLIPCPIADETAPWEVLPAANRAVMEGLDYFIVENTRTARRFLAKAGIGPIDTLEFRELNEHTVAGSAVEELVAPLAAGRSAGVISEAGVPGVADPGALVVEACHRRGIRVVPLVGPSSILLAVMASGLNGQSFAFNGYLPVKPAERAQAIRRYERRAQSEGQTQSPLKSFVPLKLEVLPILLISSTRAVISFCMLNPKNTELSISPPTLQ